MAVYLSSETTHGTEPRSAHLSLDVSDDIGIDSAFWYVDRETGNVWERSPQGANDDTTGWTEAGRFIPNGDGTQPDPVAGLMVTATYLQQADGSDLPAFSVTWDSNVETDITQYEIQWDISPTDWSSPNSALVGADVWRFTTGPVIGNTAYDFRIRALDLDNTPSAWSSTVTVTSLLDMDPPPMVTGLSASAGYRMAGLTWNRSTEADIAYYQVRFYEGSVASADPVNEPTLRIIQASGNHAIIANLEPDVAYMFSARAVDRSGNVSETSLAGGNVASGNNTYGWCTEVTATPLGVGAADIAFNSIVANFVSTGELSADSITSGSLTLGGSGITSLTVYDSTNQEFMTISDSGIVMWLAEAPTRALWASGGGIRFSSEYTGNIGTTSWSTAVTAEGINASAITFGTETGGHNRIANSGMETYTFPTVLPSTKTWTSSADWGTATSTVNLNTGGTSLTMTSV